ncbi:MAG: phage portal protein [Tepidisphaeraceae bacterium]
MGVVDGFKSVFGASKGTVPDAPGFTWKPGDARIKDYKTYRQIFDGEHATALAEQYKIPTDQLHVIVNLARLVVTIPADLMLGEPFTVDYPDDAAPSKEHQKAVSEILRRSKLQTTAYEAAVDGGYYGDMLYVVERDENEKAKIRAITPDIWFPEMDPDNVRDVRVHRLAWERTAVENKQQKKFLRVLEHHKGTIKNRLFEVDTAGKIGEELPRTHRAWGLLYGEDIPPEEQDTGVDDFLLVHVPTFRSSKDYFGRSRYRDQKGLFGAVNERTSHNNKILRDHAEPSMGITEQMWQWVYGKSREDGGASVLDRMIVEARKLKVFRKGPNGEQNEYITWDGKVEDSESFTKRLKQDILDLSEIDNCLVSSEGVGSVASGRALRLRLVRTLGMVNRGWKYQRDGLESIITVAAKLEGIEIEDMIIEKSDGLPADTLEDIQASTQRINAGLSSRVREIMRLEDLDEVEAQALIDEIDEEDAAAMEKITSKAVANGGGRAPISVAFGGDK